MKIGMMHFLDRYKQFGYVIYRRVVNYYSGEEDAFDMRKALSRDPEGKSLKTDRDVVQAHEVS